MSQATPPAGTRCVRRREWSGPTETARSRTRASSFVWNDASSVSKRTSHGCASSGTMIRPRSGMPVATASRGAVAHTLAPFIPVACIGIRTPASDSSSAVMPANSMRMASEGLRRGIR